MQNLALDPNTGDYIIQKGRPVEDGTLNTPCYIRLKTRRTTWLFAPDNKFGADYYLFHTRHLPANDPALLAVGQRALQPLIDSGRASSVIISETASSDTAFEAQAQVTQANGQETTLQFTPVTN